MNDSQEFVFQENSFFKGLRLNCQLISWYLERFVMSEEDLVTLGFPTQHLMAEKIVTLNVNAEEFVPRVNALKSSSSDMEVGNSSNSDTYAISKSLNPEGRECARCKKTFFIDSVSGDYLKEEACSYHWGKAIRARDMWTCCGQSCNSYSPACDMANNHVWSTKAFGDPSLYVSTKPANHTSIHIALSLDCEMCYTKKGMEVCKVALVDIGGATAYERYVVPDAAVVDYATRFSGVTKEHLNDPNVLTLKEVQCDLLQMISTETILIGHGLDSDLRALKIIHPKVIDTSVIYEHRWGLPYRISLKALSEKYLRRAIQNGPSHDPVEDAKAAGDLVLEKVAKQFYTDHFSPN